MNLTLRFLFTFLLLSQYSWAQKITFTSINTGTQASFRGLSVVNNLAAWVSGSKGTYGFTLDGGKTWSFQQIKGYEQYDFRSLFAFNATTAVIANAGSPAYILKTNDGGKSWKEVYKNENKDAFIDGIDFWNTKEGIIYGDPIQNKMLLLHTSDGGDNWTEQSLESRPQLKDGEASFAASGTTIRCIDKQNTIIATGGKTSRLWISNDKGLSWKAQSTPIIQGESSQGIFSVTFKNDIKSGVIVGGDFQQDTLKENHVFYTEDGGANWNRPVSPTRGYRECVEYISKNTLIATGPSGTDISYDDGKNWSAVSDEKSFHLIRKTRKGSLVIMAGGQGKVSIVKVEK